MLKWMLLREEKPHLFENVDVKQQPAAWRDKVSKCIDQGGSRGIGAGPGALGLLAGEVGGLIR